MSQAADIAAESPSADAPRLDGPMQRAELMLLAIVILIGTGMRVLWLSGMPRMNGDECLLSILGYKGSHGLGVEWIDPNKHLIDPFFLVPVMLLHHFFAPNILLIRSVSVAGGLLMLPFNYWLCRRAYGRPTAVVTTMLVSAMPAAIAYSRFGWETLQAMPACLAMLYCAVLANTQPSRRPFWFGWALAAAAVAFIVYPVCITVAALIAILLAWPWRGEIARLSKSANGLSRLGLAGVILLLLACSAFAVARHIWPVTVEPIAHPANLLWMAIGTGQFMDGQTIARYFTDQAPPGPATRYQIWYEIGALDIIFTLLVFGGAAWLCFNWRDEQAALDRALAIGVVLSIIFTFVLADIAPIGEAYNRMFFPVSSAIVVMMARTLLRVPGLRGPLAATAAICAYWLVFMAAAYFAPAAHSIARTGRSIASFDPMVQSLEFIQADSKGQQPIIISRDYFGYEPMAYLTLAKPNVQTIYAPDLDRQGPIALQQIFATGRVYWVTVGTDKQKLMEAQLAQAGLRFTEFTALDFEGHPTDTVFHILAR